MANSFFSELKRRNVFKVGIAYLVLAWVVIQVTAQAVPAFSMPEWVDTVVFFFGILGFPFAIFFAWAFEVTPDGIMKESDIAPEDSITSHTGRKLDFTIIGLLVIALGYFVYESRFNPQPMVTTIADTAIVDSTTTDDLSTQTATQTDPTNEVNLESDTTSIAVLPFVNMSSDPANEYFSDGISEELLNLLAKIPKLQVTSRSSAFSYKGKDINISEVAKVLGVKNILEGSVRKSGTRVRITAQLINAETDKHLWSDTYDRELDDIFKVQDEISAAIVVALKETLGIELVKTTSEVRSINPEAYDLYLHGLRGIHERTFDAFEESVVAFESAIKIAPDFLMARIKLAEVYARQIATGSRFDTEILDTAEMMINDVLAIKPDSAEAYHAMSWISWYKDEINLANQSAEKAYQFNPNNVEILRNHADSNGAKMGEAKARALFERAQRLDPLNAMTLRVYANYLKMTLQAYSESETLYKQSIKMNPLDGNTQFNLAILYSENMGNLADAIRLIDISAKLDSEDPDGHRYLSMYYLSLGDEQKTLSYADMAIAINIHNADAIDAKVNTLIYQGEVREALKLVTDSLEHSDTLYRRVGKAHFLSRAIYLLLKDNKLDEAKALTNKYLPKLSKLVEAHLRRSANDITNRHSIMLLSTVYRALGKNDEANKLAELLTRLDEDFYAKGQKRLMSLEYLSLAQISAVQNNNDKAVRYLESAIDDGYLANWRSEIKQSPYFLTLGKNPKYIALIKRLEAEMVKQKAELEKL